MTPMLLLLVIGLPAVAALACAVVPWRGVRTALILLTGISLAAASIALFVDGKGTCSPQPLFGLSWDAIVAAADFALLGLMLVYAVLYRSAIVAVLVVLQAGPLAFFESQMLDHHAEVPAFAIDNLALVMVLIVSLIGSIIVAFAVPYMQEHEGHLKLTRTRQPRFFFFMVLFLGAMNGLVLSNNLLWLYFFFEITTFCSFMLIGHDGTPLARTNAVRALWMNSAGGVAFVVGIFGVYGVLGTVDLQKILAHPAGGMLLVPVAALCFAGFTKAAQIPCQSWLLGAMVAPTPVSALLHSSTMVKAGVYLVVRLAPTFAGTFMSTAIATCGAFTFVAAAAMAVGQSNGKKILAYSTISNLGLIIACAGLATPGSLSAAVYLMVFHAVSKGLLFLAVGTIEQGIGSRDIEDMWGLYVRMPRTTLVAVIGILTMMAPPFGVLLSKWVAIEAASRTPVIVALIAIGSALSVVVYTRWAGMMLRVPSDLGRPAPEVLAPLTKVALYSLAAVALLLPAAVPTMYSRVLAPLFNPGDQPMNIGVAAVHDRAFALYGLYGAFVVGLLLAFVLARPSGRVRFTPPYMSGVPADRLATAFVGPMNAPVTVISSNYYVSALFGEERLTVWVNAGAVALLALVVVAGAVR